MKIFLIFLLLITTLSITFQKWSLIQKQCNQNHKIDQLCSYNPFDQKSPSYDCSIDQIKSELCKTHFTKCKLEVNSTNQFFPYCSECYTNSPASSHIYQLYQQCIKSKSYSLYFIEFFCLLVMIIIIN